ncbi:MAG: bifunctional oligoribonuclease/PAP phosphatase NrnA [Anaerolineaceae bacterium]|jgi:phosphoesterase RecJ-like protein|nr:bifunctional oligoribonuclease/PAP phosphatase NrnA [Anaerolineaceae bacterium]MDI9530999.1 bifunctional oligoribonuclease/PAP phosphatase NrnA [Chloroflexota bacterium]
MTGMNNSLDNIIREQLIAAPEVVIVGHIRPDGDAVGSMLGLAHALRAKGKHVDCVLQDGMPAKYAFLPGAEEVLKTVPQPCGYLIVVDSSDIQRTGSVLDGIQAPDLVIDHHNTHDAFGKIDYVEPETEATALILAEKLPCWGFPITPDAATCLLAGLLSDTIGFRTGNTKPAALRAAADLMEKGADFHKVYLKTLSDKTLAEARYWGQGLSKIRQNGTIIWSTLTLHDRMKSNYQGNDDADLINILSAIQGPLMTILFVEQEGGKVKVSWRSVEGVDVSKLAREFGGGGHKAAAGADIEGNLQEIQNKVIISSEKYLKEIGLN